MENFFALESADEVVILPHVIIRSATCHERELVKEFVCRVHIDVSGYNEAAKAQQISELRGDFPMLFDDVEWINSKSWLCIDKATNTMIGCIGLHRQSPNVAEIAYFFLESTARGKGYGRALIRHAISWTKKMKDENGAQIFSEMDVLTLRVYMEPAIALYESEGFIIYHEYNSTFFHVIKLRLKFQGSNDSQ